MELYGCYVTPPLVVTLLFSVFCRRFTEKAATWTLAGGMALSGIHCCPRSDYAFCSWYSDAGFRRWRFVGARGISISAFFGLGKYRDCYCCDVSDEA